MECEETVINEVDDAVEVWWKHCEEQYTHEISNPELIHISSIMEIEQESNILKAEVDRS